MSGQDSIHNNGQQASGNLHNSSDSPGNNLRGQHRRRRTHEPAASSHGSHSHVQHRADGNCYAVSSSVQAEIEKQESMIYLEGPQIYTCAQCRTHLTSHDDIISKSFHGRHGRAYLFDQCVNVTLGPPEDRMLITGMHSVCDIFCNRCKTLVGWTYAKAYEPSQKYKEGKFIIEKIHLHLEETLYGIQHPAGERADKWRVRSMSWGSADDRRKSWDYDDRSSNEIVYEYALPIAGMRERSATVATGNTVTFAIGDTSSASGINSPKIPSRYSRSGFSSQVKNER